MNQFNKWTLVVFGVSVLSLAACGENEDTEESPTGKGPQQEETIEYEALNGVQQIPANPERVVLLSDVYFGYLQELDVNVIATTDYVFQSPFLNEYTDGVENLGDGSAVSVEEVLALDPDLIISYHNSEILEQLEDITTTVAVDYATLGYKEQLMEFGEMFGRQDQAAEWIDNWESQIDELKPDVQAAVVIEQSLLCNRQKAMFDLYGNGWGRGGEILYEELELMMLQRLRKK
ncbi:ABC transporter substrate-binding protein [Bacillus sp. JCM 19041]|uniref:ABC transporter substrate-binding protein n=1 Tax=Bacillus sp. JCM 19041 TaxID=1460637 RepID=UPI0006D2085B